jgi:hypothetical protein
MSIYLVIQNADAVSAVFMTHPNSEAFWLLASFLTWALVIVFKPMTLLLPCPTAFCFPSVTNAGFLFKTLQ